MERCPKFIRSLRKNFMSKELYPFLFKPVYKNYIWGGSSISEEYKRNISDNSCAESWEISDRSDGMSIIENGYYKNQTLKSLINSKGKLILGSKAKGNSFPLLIKIIDAKKKLSLQVHPNNKSSKKYGGEAKTELWYILKSKNASIYHGFNDKMSKSDFKDALKKNILDEKIKRLSVSKNDSILVEGGCIHAIGEGCLILEIQQNSNTTYRIHDWNRDKSYNRELHIEEAINVINWNKKFKSKIKPRILSKNNEYLIEEIGYSSFFKVERLQLISLINVRMDETSFHAIFVTDGKIRIKWNKTNELLIPIGRSCLIPSSIQSYDIIGKGSVIRTSLP